MRIYRKWLRFSIRLTLLLIFIVITRNLLSWWAFLKKHPVLIYPSQEELLIELETLLQDLVAREQSSGCEMPVLDPFSKEAAKFDQDIETVACDGEDWVECNLSECFVKKSILNQMKKVSCSYMDIMYIDDDHCDLGAPIRVNYAGKYFLNNSDYVKISCSGIKFNSQKRIWWDGRKAGFRPVAPVVSAHTSSLNVLLLIIDSTSRSTFIRRMPISYKVLKKELKAVVMDGYNIVGESTAGALWPILTGHNELEVLDSKKRPTNSRRVDPYPFLFTLLKKYGYRTAFFEDMPWFHTFNYRFNGFERMPADHYMRILFQDIGWSNQNNWTDEERYCFGSELLFKFMVNYSAKLFKLKTNKFCVTLSGTFSHDDMNTITMIDEDLAHFLRTFKRNRHLDATLLFVMADHGSRVSDIRNTYQGRIEEYLPFVSVVLPMKLKQSRPSALSHLLHNSKVLTTPFDIHTTILDALGLKNRRNMYKIPGATLERGMSFLGPIPDTRSCGEAGVRPHFCACARWQSVTANDIIYRKVGWELLRFINGVTKPHRPMCAERELLSISEVYRLGPMIDFKITVNASDGFTSSRDVLDLRSRLKANTEYYQAKIITNPGEAIFEGSMQYNVKEQFFIISDRDVSRVNRYGEEAWCVSRTHPHLGKYCYCVEKQLFDCPH